jgi:DNA polymerase III epsilon subunit-like protein
MDVIVWDVEANGLTRDVSQIHCIVIQDLNTQEVKRYHDYWALPQEGTLQEGIDRVANADCIIGHNIAGYDRDVLKRIGRAQFREDQIVVDTMLLSCILHPNMQMNGLEAWAKKLKLDDQKIKNEDWTRLTEKILTRCVSDVKINRAVYLHLLKEVQRLQKGHGDILSIGDALELENKVSEIHTKQVLHGIFYDVHLAEELVKRWSTKMGVLRKRILDLAPKRLVKPYSVEVKKIYLKQNKKQIREKAPKEYTKAVKDWYNHPDNFKDRSMIQHIKYVKGPFSRIRYDKINLDSGGQVKDFMLSIGWIPTQWNWTKDDNGQHINTSPKLTEDSYGSLPEGLGTDVASYNVLKHRLSLLVNKKDKDKGSLPLARKRYNADTGLGNVAADAFTCGTNTARYRHTKPVANLPGVDAVWGS